MPARPALHERELVEDLLRPHVPSLRRPFSPQPGVELVEALLGLEHTPYDELRRDRAVPVVLLEPERDVVPADAPIAVELRAVPERNRAAGVDSPMPHTEPQVLALADGRELRELACRREQRHRRVPEPERRQPPQLAAE